MNEPHPLSPGRYGRRQRPPLQGAIGRLVWEAEEIEAQPLGVLGVVQREVPLLTADTGTKARLLHRWHDRVLQRGLSKPVCAATGATTSAW